MRKTETFLETLMFRSRWLLAPFFFGLIIAIAAMLLKFCKQLAALLTALFLGAEHEDRPAWMGKGDFPTSRSSSWAPSWRSLPWSS